MLVEQLGVAAPGGVVPPLDAVALGQAEDYLVGRHALHPDERAVLRLRVGIATAVEEAVGHRETVGRQDGDRQRQGRENHLPSPSVASEKFQTSAERQTSITPTSFSYGVARSARMITGWPG